MKKIFLIALCAVSCFVIGAGCLTGTRNTIREYDSHGALLRETVTGESVVKTFTDATRGKIVYINEQSWLAGMIFVPPASDLTNVSGAAKILAGQEDRQYISIPAGAGVDTKYLPEIIKTARAGGISAGAISADSGK